MLRPRTDRWLAQAAASLTALTALSAPALAQDKDLVPDEVKVIENKDKRKQGWDTTLSVGATINFVDNRTVVGQTDGSNWTLGGAVNGSVTYLKDAHEFRSALLINENFSRTAVIPEFLNTSDVVILDATYYYTFTPWLGVFGRAELQTNLFSGFVVFPETKDFQVTRRRGDVDTLTGSDRLRVRDPLGLTTIKESVGGFLRPLDRKSINMELRAGLGSRQVLANDQIALDDNKDTPQIEARELRNFQQIGAELALTAKGTLEQDKVAYRSSVEALMPFYNSINPMNKSVLALTGVESVTQISFKLVEWASLDYQIKVLRQPLITQDWQVQNSLLLTFGYTLIEETKN